MNNDDIDEVFTAVKDSVSTAKSEAAQRKCSACGGELNGMYVCQSLAFDPSACSMTDEYDYRCKKCGQVTIIKVPLSVTGVYGAIAKAVAEKKEELSKTVST